MTEPASEESNDSSHESSQLSLSCSFSSFEDGSPHSESDDTDELAVGMVEPYMYEPEVPVHEGSAPTSESDDGESSNEGRTGNTDW